ncbi:hypothetical protein Rs2_09154 [Raphanus sativus]|nr:hypothetical protein Rs2_09154 [Raphanus sativus]
MFTIILYCLEKESVDIERFSDSLKLKKSGSFYDYLVLRPDNFPKELLGDTRREQHVKRAISNQEADLQKLDDFEKLEAKSTKIMNEDFNDDYNLADDGMIP